MKWNGRYYRPGYGIVVYPKKEANIQDLLKPLGEKEDKGNVWRPVLNQPINVFKEPITPPPPPSSSPTPTPTGSGTPTPTPTATLTPTPTPSFVPPLDPDAVAFFDAIDNDGGTLTPTEEDAVNQLVLDLKFYGLWNKMIALYPVVGSTAVEQKYNLKNPAQYNLTFNGTWTHSSAGVDPVTNAYAQTGIIPSVIDFQSSGSVHFSMYITEDVGNTRYDMGAYSAGGGDWGMISEFNGNNTAYIGVGTNFFTTGNGGSTKKNWLMTNDGATSYIYRDGSVIGSGAKTISTGATVELVLNANNNSGSVVDNSTRSWALSSIGLGMDATEASNYNTAVVTFQTALSRQN